MLDIGIELFEAAFVKQHIQPLARGQLAFGMLRIDALLPSTQLGRCTAAFHFGDIGGHQNPCDDYECVTSPRQAMPAASTYQKRSVILRASAGEIE